MGINAKTFIYIHRKDAARNFLVYGVVLVRFVIKNCFRNSRKTLGDLPLLYFVREQHSTCLNALLPSLKKSWNYS